MRCLSRVRARSRRNPALTTVRMIHLCAWRRSHVEQQRTKMCWARRPLVYLRQHR